MTLPSHLARIVEAEYPRFSEAEMTRRRAAVEALLAQAECDHLVFCGANRFGSVVQWLTQWPVTAEAVGIFTPRERDALFVQWVNHAPQAQILADRADVAWGGESSIAEAIAVLGRRGARQNRVATMGPVSAEQHAALAAKYGKPKNLNRDYIRLRQVKSADEIDWLRIGAHFSDLGMAALRDGARPGLNERELGDLVERVTSRRVRQTSFTTLGSHRCRNRSSVCRVSFRGCGAFKRATLWWPRSARRSGNIRGRCCAVSHWASRASFIGICTLRRMPPSMQSPRC